MIYKATDPIVSLPELLEEFARQFHQPKANKQLMNKIF